MRDPPAGLGPLAGGRAAESAPRPAVEVRDLSVRAGPRLLLHEVNLTVPPRQVFGLIGPSGAGKSTLLKCLNRLIDLTPGLTVSGDVRLDGVPVYAPGVNPDDLRARVGMLFQQPVVFPKSVYKNVIFGVRHLGDVRRHEWPAVAERALREA